MVPSLDKPPQLLDSEKYIFWKKRFEVFVKAISPRLWKIIEFGAHILPSEQNEWDEMTETMLRENNLATHLLYSALPDQEYKKIYRCDTAHDIWKALEMIYEGNSQCKEHKIKRLTDQFDTFKMFWVNATEPVENLYERYIGIINSLEALGKSYTNVTYIKKFLSALPPEWNVEVKAILGSKNLSLLSL